ncbi:hypothetical protein A4G19_03295 [Pasteurellaceae bacterium Macca]|nr:hypothetical protein [Pasteurellaceae bacterium Macca]
MRKLLLITMMLSMLTGCATIVGEDTQTIPINSEPSGAIFKIKDTNGKLVFQGVTPSSVTLQKSTGEYFGEKDYEITFHKSGYKDKTYFLDSHPNGWYLAGNLIFAGFPGYLLDPFSGKMFDISPETVNVQLENNPQNLKKKSRTK